MPLEKLLPDNFEQNILDQLEANIGDMDLENLAILLAEQAAKKNIKNPTITLTFDTIDGENGAVEDASLVSAGRTHRAILPNDIIAVPRNQNDKK